MKKIIALAIAGAFVAPATYAAEVTLGGEVEFVYTSTDSATDKVTASDNLIKVTATEELPNGMTATATMVIMDDTSADAIEQDGSSIALAGAHGTIAVGDVAGALDATGDWTDVAPAGGGFAMDGKDAAISWTLPALIENLNVIISHSPEGANNAGVGNEVQAGADAYSVTYSMNGISVYYGTEEYGAPEDQYTAYGIKGSVAGISLAYEAGDKEPNSGTKTEYTGLSATYKFGDVVVGMESQKTETGTTVATDDRVMFVEYNLGSNVDVYFSAVDSANNATNDNDATYVGVEYNF